MTGERMPRREVSKLVKRTAWTRSEGRCEASGSLYGLEPNQRCNAPLSKAVIYDHINPVRNSDDATLENCLCICEVCNRIKTYGRDLPMLAKTQRLEDKRKGIGRQKRKIQSRPFRWAWTPRVRDIND